MNAQEERDGVKAALDEELERIRFAGSAQVLERTHPRGWRRRLHAFWNKELEIPVVPLAAMAAVLAGTLLWGRLRNEPDSGMADSGMNRVLVEEGANVYWKDEYERAVASIATEDSR